jgi:hypothetical protein
MIQGANQEKLRAFLTELSKDTKMQEAFCEDPGACMSARGLTGREQWLVMTGNSRLINENFDEPEWCGVIVKY